jgi:hypothetical protein
MQRVPLYTLECEGDASPLASVRGRRTLTRLDPDVYPDRPDVSFVIQYFKQPELIKPLAGLSAYKLNPGDP